MLTYSGVHVTKEFGAPTIRDIAVQGMRLVRFSGAAEVFWPIGMHMMLVADLMPKTLGNDPRVVYPSLEVYALLHDAAEVCVADVPRPMKTAEARALEDRVQSRIYTALGVPEPSDEIKKAVKDADFRAALAEGALGCAGRGFEQTQTGFMRDAYAEAVLAEYLQHFKVGDALDPNGQWALLYEERLRIALREAQHGVSYAPGAEVSA
jgi:5'-deoxynucleotidase YfbR-like HD superfamily hydrolase